MREGYLEKKCIMFFNSNFFFQETAPSLIPFLIDSTASVVSNVASIAWLITRLISTSENDCFQTVEKVILAMNSILLFINIFTFKVIKEKHKMFFKEQTYPTMNKFLKGACKKECPIAAPKTNEYIESTNRESVQNVYELTQKVKKPTNCEQIGKIEEEDEEKIYSELTQEKIYTDPSSVYETLVQTHPCEYDKPNVL